MEYNIYDLMEGVADDTIALSQSGAADLRRIEELTMNKIKEQTPPRRAKKPARRITRMVLVAAIAADAIGEIEGVDLVTEGVITISKVIEYAKDSLDKNELYEQWSMQRDGASLICRMLFEEATDINFFVGRAVNPAHQNPDLPINFNIKMNLVEELSACLKKMGKRIKVSYF